MDQLRNVFECLHYRNPLRGGVAEPRLSCGPSVVPAPNDTKTSNSKESKTMNDTTYITLSIPVSLTCRDQSGDAHQLGFRLLGDAEIRAFGHAFTAPCAIWGWSSFAEWEEHLDSLPRGARIHPYTRELTIHDGVQAVRGHLTIARNTRTARVARAQGSITARKDSPLYGFVVRRLRENVDCRFVPGRDRDALLLPGAAWTASIAA